MSALDTRPGGGSGRRRCGRAAAEPGRGRGRGRGARRAFLARARACRNSARTCGRVRGCSAWRFPGACARQSPTLDSARLCAMEVSRAGRGEGPTHCNTARHLASWPRWTRRSPNATPRGSASMEVCRAEQGELLDVYGSATRAAARRAHCGPLGHRAAPAGLPAARLGPAAAGRLPRLRPPGRTALAPLQGLGPRDPPAPGLRAVVRAASRGRRVWGGGAGRMQTTPGAPYCPNHSLSRSIRTRASRARARARSRRGARRASAARRTRPRSAPPRRRPFSR